MPLQQLILMTLLLLSFSSYKHIIVSLRDWLSFQNQNNMIKLTDHDSATYHPLKISFLLTCSDVPSIQRLTVTSVSGVVTVAHF